MKWRVIKINTEVSGKKEAMPGMSLLCENYVPEIVGMYDSKEEGLKALEAAPVSTATWRNGLWQVEEYLLEEYESDENGGFLKGSDFDPKPEMQILGI